MVTQVMTEFTLRKKNLQSIATKVLLQIIAKRGNILWVPKTICKIENTILLAFDSSKLGSQTLLSVCATINSTFSSIYSKSVIYGSNDERFGKMVQLHLAVVDSYIKRNTNLPKEIIVFMNSVPGDQTNSYL